MLLAHANSLNCPIELTVRFEDYLGPNNQKVTECLMLLHSLSRFPTLDLDRKRCGSSFHER